MNQFRKIVILLASILIEITIEMPAVQHLKSGECTFNNIMSFYKYYEWCNSACPTICETEKKRDSRYTGRQICEEDPYRRRLRQFLKVSMEGFLGLFFCKCEKCENSIFDLYTS